MRICRPQLGDGTEGLPYRSEEIATTGSPAENTSPQAPGPLFEKNVAGSCTLALEVLIILSECSPLAEYVWPMTRLNVPERAEKERRVLENMMV